VSFQKVDVSPELSPKNVIGIEVHHFGGVKSVVKGKYSVVDMGDELVVTVCFCVAEAAIMAARLVKAPASALASDADILQSLI
jgi:hypothetical protein